jgi:hypothetical protein
LQVAGSKSSRASIQNYELTQQLEHCSGSLKFRRVGLGGANQRGAGNETTM